MINGAKRPGRSLTREKILDVTLGLFNERGPDRVTTAEIAGDVKINEGNLYYHFRTKESLVLALFARFENDALALVATVDGADEAAAAVMDGRGRRVSLRGRGRGLGAGRAGEERGAAGRRKGEGGPEERRGSQTKCQSGG